MEIVGVEGRGMGGGGCLGGGGISARGGDWGRGGGGDIVGRRKSILGAFFGAWARFLVAGGMDIPENLFCRCTGIKTAF